MAYGPSKTSLFQTASNSAATLTAAGITDVDAFRAIRDELYSDLLAIMETEVAEAPAPASTRSFSGGSTNDNPGDTVLNFGKFSGKTIAAVFSENPGYVKDFLTKSRNEFIAKKVNAFLAQLG